MWTVKTVQQARLYENVFWSFDGYLRSVVITVKLCLSFVGSIASEESVRITPSLRSKKGYTYAVFVGFL